MKVKKYYFKKNSGIYNFGPYYATRVQRAWMQLTMRNYGNTELKWKDAKKGWEYTIEK